MTTKTLVIPTPLPRPTRPIRVYVAGPLRGVGADVDQEANVRAAINAAEEVLRAGYDHYLPHLNVAHDRLYPRGGDQWVKRDLVWLRLCDAVYVFSRDPSVGTMEEVHEAKLLGIPVVYSVAELDDLIPIWDVGLTLFVRVKCRTCAHRVQISALLAQQLGPATGPVCWCCQPAPVRTGNRRAWRVAGLDVDREEQRMLKKGGCSSRLCPECGDQFEGGDPMLALCPTCADE